MKPAKLFSSIFAVLGTGVMALSIVLCLWCRNSPPKAQEIPQAAESQSRQFMSALSAGDYETAGGLIYGQPSLHVQCEFQSTAASLLWEAFLGSISWEEPGACYLEGTDIYRDVTITTLDVSQVLSAVPNLAQSLRETREEESPDVLLLEAVREAASHGNRVSVSGRLRLVQDKEQWYVIPDPAILSALSGNL